MIFPEDWFYFEQGPHIDKNPPVWNMILKYNGISHSTERVKFLETRYYSNNDWWPGTIYFKAFLVHTTNGNIKKFKKYNGTTKLKFRMTKIQ